MLCTIYSKTIRSKKEKTSILDLEELGARFQTDEKRRRTVEAFRAELPTLPPHFHWKDINRLPQICPGLFLKTHRNGQQDANYNGVVLLEVSGLSDLAEADRVKARVAGWPTTLAAFTGASGKSVKILVGGTLDDGSLPREEEATQRFHQALYTTCAAAYTSVICRPLKAKIASPDDTFRWTYDPTAFVNPNAQPIQLQRRDVWRNTPAGAGEEMRDNALEYSPEAAQPTTETRKLYRRRFALAMKQAREKLLAIDSTYSPTLANGKGSNQEDCETKEANNAERLLEATAMEALQLSIPQEESVWLASRNMNFLNLGNDIVRTTVESVYLENPQKSGTTRTRDMQETAFSLQHFMQTRYDLRFNELTNGVEWRHNESSSYIFQPLDSRVLNTMLQEAHESGLEITERELKRFLGSTRVRNFHAARAYLRSVEGCWDGQTDYIGALAERVPTTNPHWKEWFHTWFLGMVAQWDSWDNLHANSTAPLLMGPQGCGKSTFGQLLLPPELRDVGYRELVDFSSKNEAEKLLTTALLVNLDEFQDIPEKIQQGFLKNLIQKTSVKGKRPYSTALQNLPRFASFIATTNRADVLSDPTGSRRFLVAEILHGTQIDTSGPIPYAKIYAQAIDELEAGKPRHYFTPEQVAQIETHNSRYANVRIEVLQFLDIFELATRNDETTTRMKLSDIIDAVQEQNGCIYSNKEQNYLGRWLTNEARMSHVRKTTSNGSPMYLLRKRK
ncbi:MAG: DUF5906 domain-containing protein [Bacteroidaceae bacterium]|nr:DUF5906 domain-containing protein [Bacteroidaceae bacterium]